MKVLDLDKFTQPPPMEWTDAIRELGECKIELLKVVQVIETALLYPDMVEWNTKRMQEVFDKYSKEN